MQPHPELIVSVSGLRGILGRSLTPDTALSFVRAFAATLPPGPLVVARDGRDSGPLLALAVECALRGVGRTVLNADVAATPTVGVLVRTEQAVGGVQISASHNPPEYNGLKLFDARGQVLSSGAGEEVAVRFRGDELADWVAHRELGDARALWDPQAAHLELVLSTVDVEAIRRKRFRVLLDANHGSGSLLGQRLLEALGCEVVLLDATPDGQFAHPPEPTEENLRSVQELVRSAKVDLGFCQDPDADRLAILDHEGRYLGEEATLALCVEHRLGQQPGPVVINCASSRMTREVARAAGVTCTLSKVGEANVCAEMQAREAVIGGEGNGGVIDPRVGYVRDSFAGMALILEGMAARGQTIAAWAAGLPPGVMLKSKLAMSPKNLAPACEQLVARLRPDEVSRLDGWRLDWPDRWLLVRPSNTEPIVRLIAEAPTAAEVYALTEKASAALRDNS